MKIVLDVSNIKKGIKPSKDNIIIYDGEKWYVTTKNDLFAEYDERFDEKLAECDEKIASMSQYQKDIASQMLSMQEIIQKLIVKESK